MNGMTLPAAAKKDALIVGMGLTGRSVARWLAQQGHDFDMADTRESLADSAQLRLDYPQSELFLGEGDEIDLSAYQRLVLSPGLSPTIRLVQRAAAAGLPVCGDIDLFADQARAPVIAVTGANGKSTVVDWLHHVLLAAGKQSRLGGNFGTPVLELLDDAAEVYVLELSSFQLDTAEALRADIATLLNVTEDHMDRYASLAEYAASKQRIYRDVRVAVVNLDDVASQQGIASASRQIRFSLQPPVSPDDYGVINVDGGYWLARGESRLLNTSELKLFGRHNWANALAVLALAEGLGLAPQAVLPALCGYQGLPHRTEWIADIGGVSWVNDSKATNVGAVVAALSGLDRPALLLAGGDGKGADFSPLQAPVAQHVRKAYLFGKDREALATALTGITDIARVETLDEAVSAAANDAREGEVVLLSPACASLDQFANYTVRGDRFRQLVQVMAGGVA